MIKSTSFNIYYTNKMPVFYNDENHSLPVIEGTVFIPISVLASIFSMNISKLDSIIRTWEYLPLADIRTKGHKNFIDYYLNPYQGLKLLEQLANRDEKEYNRLVQLVTEFMKCISNR